MKKRKVNNMKPVMTLHIDKFEINANLSEAHACGGWNRRFHAEIDLDCDELDENGFVVENETLIKSIRDYFKDSKYEASCEQLCQCIVDLAVVLMGMRLACARVKVYNLTGCIHIKWKRGDELPEVPKVVIQRRDSTLKQKAMEAVAMA